MVIFIVLLSFIPSILIYILLRNNRKDDPDYHKDCRKALFGGMLCSFGVALFSLLMNILWNLSGIGKIIPVLNGIFYAFVLEATSEELMKYLTAQIGRAHV